MAKRSRKLSTKRPKRSKSSSRKTMKRTKRQPSKKRTLKKHSSKKRTLKKHSSKKRKSRTKSVRKRKKTKKIVGGAVLKFKDFMDKYNREFPYSKMKELTDERYLKSQVRYLKSQVGYLQSLKTIHRDSGPWSLVNYAQIKGRENYYLIFLSKKSSVRIKALFIMKGIINHEKPFEIGNILESVDKIYKPKPKPKEPKSDELNYDAILSFITEQLQLTRVASGDVVYDTTNNEDGIGDSGEGVYSIPTIPRSAASSAASADAASAVASAAPEYAVVSADVGTDVVVDNITSNPYYFETVDDTLLNKLQKQKGNTFLVSKSVKSARQHIYTIYVVSESLYHFGTQDDVEKIIHKFHIYYRKESSGKIVYYIKKQNGTSLDKLVERDNIDDLIEHYKENPFDGSGLILKDPIKKNISQVYGNPNRTDDENE